MWIVVDEVVFLQVLQFFPFIIVPSGLPILKYHLGDEQQTHWWQQFRNIVLPHRHAWASWQCSFSGLWHHVDWQINTNVSNKHTIPIFMAEVAVLCCEAGRSIGPMRDDPTHSNFPPFLWPYINLKHFLVPPLSPEDGCNMFLLNVDIYLRVSTASHPEVRHHQCHKNLNYRIFSDIYLSADTIIIRRLHHRCGYGWAWTGSEESLVSEEERLAPLWPAYVNWRCR
jgi:hypothetical protein